MFLRVGAFVELLLLLLLLDDEDDEDALDVAIFAAGFAVASRYEKSFQSSRVQSPACDWLGSKRMCVCNFMYSSLSGRGCGR